MPDSISSQYLRELGVAELPALTSPFDPGDAPSVVEGHLRQSAALMERVKLSMSCWIIADHTVTAEKVALARKHAVPTVAGGGPFEIAAALGKISAYLDLCANTGFDRIEVSQGFVQTPLDPRRIVAEAASRGLEIQYELGSKLVGKFDSAAVDKLIAEGTKWLSAGARGLVIEAREDAKNVGLFDEGETLNKNLGDRFVEAWGLSTVCFEAPTKRSQFALLDHYGPRVRLSNVTFAEVLRVEIYRRGLHSNAYDKPKLRPAQASPAAQ